MSGRPGEAPATIGSIPGNLTRGTFNATRYGPALATIDRQAAPWVPTAAHLAGLEPSGRARVQGTLAAYDFRVAESELLIKAATVCDRLAELRHARKACGPKERRGLDRQEQAWQKSLMAWWLSLTVRM
jgi:hypothetical protein